MDVKSFQLCSLITQIYANYTIITEKARRKQSTVSHGVKGRCIIYNFLFNGLDLVFKFAETIGSLNYCRDVFF